MSKHEPKYILIDMLDAINAMLEFTSGKTYNQFMNDRMLRDAVYRNVMVLGEASSRLSNDFILKHPNIEWHKMKSARNALVHGYDKIDDRIVWNIVNQILPSLKMQLERLLNDSFNV